MDHRILNKFLAVILFLAAYWVFDPHDWSMCAVAGVLLLSGIDALLRDSESRARREFGRACLKLAAIAAIFLILKFLLIG